MKNQVANTSIDSLVLWDLGLLGAVCMGLCFSVWIPGDSTSIPSGTVIPQVAYWLAVGCLALIKSFLTRGLHRTRPPITPRPEVPSTTFRLSTWHLGMFLAFSLLMGWLIMSVWQVQGRGNMRAAVNVAWQWVACSTAFIVFVRLSRSPWSRLVIAATLISIGGMITIHGLYQYLISMPETRAEFHADPVGSLAKEGIFAPPGSDIYMQYASRLESPEPLGPFALTNSLAGLYVLVLLLGLAWWIETDKAARWKRWSLLACLGLGLICFALTKSRGGWLALATASAGYIFSQCGGIGMLSRHRRWLGFIAGILVAIVGLIYVTDPLVLLEAPKSLAFRWQYWESSLAMIRDHGWFGVGPGNFQNYYPAYKSAIASETIADPHCFPLEIAATIGLPGLVLCGLCFCLFFVRRNPTSAAGEAASLEAGPGWLAILFPWLAAGVTWGIPELIGTPPDWFPYLIGVPLGSWLIGVLIRTPRQAPSTMACGPSPLAWRWAALGMALHLLVNGGWLTPGNTIPWMMAIALGFRSPSAAFVDTASKQHTQASISNKIGMSLLSMLVCGVMLLFLWTAWWPWQSFRQWQITQPNSPQAWIQSAHQVAETDRWNPVPQQAIVEYRYRTTLELQTRSPRSSSIAAQREEWLTAERELIDRNPHDWQTWLRSGRQRWSLMTDASEFTEARARYERAIGLYPSEVGMRIELASLLFLHDLDDEAREQLKRAIELDAATPHSNRKMGAVMVQVHFPGFLGDSNGRIQPFQKKLGSGSQGQGGEDWHRAEPVAQYLRSQLFPAGDLP